MVKAITPQQAEQARISNIPDGVIECFNDAIQENIDMYGRARVDQDDVVKKIASKMGVRRQVVFDKGWLDVESIFREAGWKVNYDKPGYNESYNAYFEFSARK